MVSRGGRLSPAARWGSTAAGLALAQVLPEPPYRFHPVAWFGRAMNRAETSRYLDDRRRGIEHVVLGAGLAGIEQGLELPPEASNNIYEMSEEERRAAGIRSLPADLHEAIGLAESSTVLRDALGEHVHEFLIRNKREEWDAYKSYVTPYELERYLPVL